MIYNHIVVDTDNVCYKNYFKLGDLSYNGLPSGAVFGTLKSFFFYKKTYPNSKIWLTWSESNNYRRQLDPEYKATRSKEGKENYFSQRDDLEIIFKAIGQNQVKIKDHEADDCIRTLITSFSSLEQSSLIISGDKDMFQLLNGNVSMLRDKKTYTPELFIREYEFKHNRMAEWLAIVGDRSDNIQGVPGVGKIGATKVIKEYRGLKSHLQAKSNPYIDDKIFTKVYNNKERFFKSLSLTDLSLRPIAQPSDNMIIAKKDEDMAIYIINKYGLHSMLKQILDQIGNYP